MKKYKFKFREKFVSASFFIAIILFVLLRVYLPTHKGYAWLAFLLIPLSPILVGLKKITISYSLLVTIIYVVLGITCDWWHPGWVLFLTIPVFYIFFPVGISSSFIKIDRDDKDDDFDDI